MESFLGQLNEQLEVIPFDWKSWQQSEIIVDAIRLATIGKSLIITILFLESYNDADVVAKANALPSEDTARWSVNGSVMYLVEAPDGNKVSEVLSVFAGKE